MTKKPITRRALLQQHEPWKNFDYSFGLSQEQREREMLERQKAWQKSQLLGRIGRYYPLVEPVTSVKQLMQRRLSKQVIQEVGQTYQELMKKPNLENICNIV